MAYAEYHRKEKERLRYLKRKSSGELKSQYLKRKELGLIKLNSNYVKKGWNPKSIGRPFVKGNTGQNAPNWKGGVRIRNNGHIQIHSPTHQNKDSDGYMMEHRLVMEQKLGRLLSSDEIVHHLDHQQNNNSINNLHLFDNKSEHTKYHRMLTNLVTEEIKQTEMIIQ